MFAIYLPLDAREKVQQGALESESLPSALRILYGQKHRLLVAKMGENKRGYPLGDQPQEVM